MPGEGYRAPASLNPKRKPLEIYNVCLLFAQQQAANDLYYPTFRNELLKRHSVSYQLSKRMFEAGIPQLNLAPIRDLVNPATPVPAGGEIKQLVAVDNRPETLIGNRFLKGLLEGGGIEAIMRNAVNDQSANQAAAWKIMLHYAIGTPRKNRDEAELEKKAIEIMERRVQQLETEKADEDATIQGSQDAHVIDVEAQPAQENNT